MPKTLPIVPLLLLLSALAWPLAASAGDYSDHPEARRFVERMVREHGLPRAEVEAVIGKARRKQSILDAIARPAEAKPWYQYRPIFLTEDRIRLGVAYWREHRAILDDVRTKLGVDPAYVVAIIGVETRYGRHAGRYRVLDALATLGFDYPPRAAFFRGQLEEFLLLAREEHIDVLEATGSYAGAMGHGQFIPGSYREYAIDFDGDGRRDLWHSPPDIIGSVANYLRRHGWQAGAPVAQRARVNGDGHRALLEKGLEPAVTVAELAGYGVQPVGAADPAARVALIELEQKDGPEYWLGYRNFYVITRYNRSPLYAMAVHQLAGAIARRMPPGGETAVSGR